ncbi:MAG: hypothetical protein ACRC8M_08665 [Cetobacterium sp.]|uniref:hypothetical protein n=1 Tax=Cetobacterium sp. TaxID=2071632 RepID=UPI003F3940D2
MISGEIFKGIIENHENGFIILNEKKEVVYMNKNIIQIYGEESKIFLGNYLRCTNALKEKKQCQHTNKCEFCTINKVIDKVIETKV